MPNKQAANTTPPKEACRSEGSEASPRVMVIGLDGATFDLINRWKAQGLLPTFQRILSEGAHGALTTIVPPLTGPAWISFMTGKNPGKHGIYDFVVRSPHHYHGTPISARQRDGESLWSILSRAGKRVGMFMVPVTYPPEPVNGFMVTGMLTPAGADDFIYPPSLTAGLMSAVPGMTVAPEGIMHPLGREHKLLEGMNQLTEYAMKATDYLMDRYDDWDFYMLVFKEPDLAMHWLWRFMDPEHPWYTEADEKLKFGLQKVYERMDKCLAELLQKAGDDTLVILMSDHGAGTLESYFHVNTWLVSEGMMHLKGNLTTQLKRLLYQVGLTPINLYKTIMYLKQGRSVAQTMKHRKKSAISLLRQLFLSFDNVDWSKTKAYSLGNYGQIYVNLKGREPQGIVSPGAEYEEVMAQLIEKLENLCDPHTGEPIPGRIYRGDKVYHGKKLDQAPDIVFLPDDLQINGFGLYQFSSNSWLERTFDRSGGHRMDGIFMTVGPGVRKGAKISNAHIIDLAPTILAAMGVPIPDDMDGQVLKEAFADDYFDDHPIRYVEAQKSMLSEQQMTYSKDATAEEEIKERLQALGYLA